MKSFVKSILVASIFTMVATTVVAQTSNSQFEQWYRAKYGRPSPMATVNGSTQQAAAATETTHTTAVTLATPGFEQWYLAKYGRPTAAEEARLETPQIYAAAPQTAQLEVTPSADDLMARTPAEHKQIAETYREQARDYLAQAKEHEAMVVAYKASPNVNAKNQAATIGHCQYFAAKFNALATRSQELAQLHEQMAKQTVGN